jgi:hypothetical protein
MKYFFPLLWLLAAVPAGAQDCCRVEGTVRAATGAPIANADIMLALPDAKDPRVGKTDGAGHYAFDKISPGIRVEIRIVADGRPIASAFTLVTSFVETLDIKVVPETTSPADIADLSPMGGDSGEIRGTVRGPDGSPIAGAHVAIAGTPVDAVTDSMGRYSFGRLRAKLAINLQATANGFAASTVEVSVPASGAQDADFALSVSAQPDNDTGLGLAATTPDRAALSLKRPSVESVPSLSPDDVFRAARMLPTAAIGQDESELFLHGSAPGESYQALDGMPWYSFPRLMAGLTTPFPTASLQETELAGTPVDTEGGGRLSGLMRMTTVRPQTSRVTGVGEVGVFGPSGTVTVPIAGIGSAMIGGRFSWPSSLYNDVLDRFSGADTTYLRTRDVHYTGGTLAPSPAIGFSSLNGRFEIAPAKGNRGYVSFYHAGDDNNFSKDALGPAPSDTIGIPAPLALPADALMQIGDVQSWTGRGVSGVWERRWAADFATTATVARTRFTNDRDQAYDLTSATMGDLSYVTLRGGSEALTEHNEIQETTVRVTATINVGFAHAIEAGVEHAAIDATYDSRSEALTGLVPLLTRTTSGAIASAFAQDVWRPTAKLTVTPGVRLTNAGLAAETFVDPRATASYAAAPHVVFKGSYAIDHQSVNRIVREDLEHGDGVFWTLSDGTVVPVARAREATAGASVEMPGLLFDAHLYYRQLDNLSMFAPRLLPGTALTAPDHAFYTGTGTALGVEFLVQHLDPRNTIWASYAGGRVEYSFPALVAGSFPASFDRQHQFKLLDSMRVVGPLTASAAFLIASGLPSTPSTGAQQVWFPSGALATAPGFGDKNSDRLPLYHQLDVSAQVARHFGAMTAAVGVTVFNVYDRQNVVGYDYEAASSTAITSQTTLMRRAGDIFFRVGF